MERESGQAEPFNYSVSEEIAKCEERIGALERELVGVLTKIRESLASTDGKERPIGASVTVSYKND